MTFVEFTETSLMELLCDILQQTIQKQQYIQEYQPERTPSSSDTV